MTELELVKKELELSKKEVALLKEKILFLELPKENFGPVVVPTVIREVVYIDRPVPFSPPSWEPYRITCVGDAGRNTVDVRGFA